MSRARVVVGVDERGRPKTAWAEPDRVDEPLYGHMQPAFTSEIERTRLSPEELAARSLTPPLPGRTAPVTPTRQAGASLAQSRQRGAQRAGFTPGATKPHLAARAAAEPPPASEETVMAIDPVNEHQAAAAVDVRKPFLDIAEAAERAHEAHMARRAAMVARDAAEAAFDQATTALREAWAAAGFEPITLALTVEVPAETMDAAKAFAEVLDATAAPDAEALAEPVEEARTPPSGDESPEDRRGRLYDETLTRHLGNARTAGEELGVRANVVARVAGAYRRRQARAIA